MFLNKDLVRYIFMNNGFTIKEGQTDLKQYVYDAAEQLEKEWHAQLLAWAVDQWVNEVKHRPLSNMHRRTLDTHWRSLITKFGGDAEALIGADHDTLCSEIDPPVVADKEGYWTPADKEGRKWRDSMIAIFDYQAASIHMLKAKERSLNEAIKTLDSEREANKVLTDMLTKAGLL